MSTKKVLKPFVKFLGGKTQLLGTLENYRYKGKVERYVEPFVGGGAFMFHLLGTGFSGEIYINDINEDLIKCYQVIRDNVVGLKAALSDLSSKYYSFGEEKQREFYLQIRDLYNSRFDGSFVKIYGGVQDAALFIFLNKTSFNGMYRVNKKNEFNVPFGRIINPLFCDEDSFDEISRIFKDVDIKVFSGDYAVMSNYCNGKTFVYMDPPYKPISSSSSFNNYYSNNFDDQEQMRLSFFCRYLNNLGAKFMLSNSDLKNFEDNGFFDTLYNGFNVERVEAIRKVNSKGDGRGKIKELIIRNYK